MDLPGCPDADRPGSCIAFGALGFGVLGFRSVGFGFFRVWGLGFRVWGLWVWGLGFWVWGMGRAGVEPEGAEYKP